MAATKYHSAALLSRELHFQPMGDDLLQPGRNRGRVEWKFNKLGNFGNVGKNALH
jgi:hypothetical protein